MLKLNNVEFYITNVCNLACEGCNRFNNYRFKGWQRWADYKDIYTQWAQELEITSHIGILGGEPLLNPDYLEWLDGLRNLWPGVRINTVTNGYRLNSVPGLYERLSAHPLTYLLKVGIHNPDSKEMILNNIREFLKGPLTYQKIYAEHDWQEKLYIIDANSVWVMVENNWNFHQGSLKQDLDTGQFSLYNSDLTVAHNNCSMKTCHTFHRGRLYKCGVAALLPEFDQQYPIATTGQQREIMMDYPGLGLEQTLEQKQIFIEQLSQPIAQCQLCPEKYQGKLIAAVEKRSIKI